MCKAKYGLLEINALSEGEGPPSDAHHVAYSTEGNWRSPPHSVLAKYVEVKIGTQFLLKLITCIYLCLPQI